MLNFQDPSSGQNCVFILAAPRSGSTFLYQLMINRFECLYLSNLMLFMYKAPLLGGLVTKYFRFVLPLNDYTSRYGRTRGLFGPAEGRVFWEKWGGFSLTEQFDYKKQKSIHLRKALNYLAHRRYPFVSCYLGHTLHFKHLQRIYPNAVFIVLKRDTTDMALSLYKASHLHNRWPFSIAYDADHLSECNDKYALVAQQAVRLKQELELIGNDGRAMEVNYEDLCQEPEETLEYIRGFLTQNGLDPSVRKLNFETVVKKQSSSSEEELRRNLSREIQKVPNIIDRNLG